MIKASLILLAAYGVALLLRRRSAAERHVLWATAIGAAALLPLFRRIIPSWQPAIAGRVAAGISYGASGQSILHGANIVIHATGLQSGNTIDLVLMAVWITGSVGVLLVLGLGSLKLGWLASRASILSDAEWNETVSDVSIALGFHRKVRLMQSSDSSMPVTWGAWHPQVLLPDCARHWSMDRKRAVLAHELAHVHRLDWLFQIFAGLACAAYWFNPLFWIARSQLSLESERACDDAVMNTGIEGQDYASHLLDIARSLKTRGFSGAVALGMARRYSLEKRLVAILRSNLNRQSATRSMILTMGFSALCVALPVAAMQPVSANSGQRTIPTRNFSAPEVVQYTTPPLYSDEARKRNIEGIVTVEARIDESGQVKNVRLVHGLGFGLDENALLAVRDWKFTAVEGVAQVAVEFSIRNAELNELIANDMATRVGPGVVPPSIIHRVEPQYRNHTDQPQPAGSVVLDAVIQEDGTPRIIRVVQSLSWEADEIAINALEQWKFSPALKDGIPVKVRMNVGMQFDSETP